MKYTLFLIFCLAIHDSIRAQLSPALVHLQNHLQKKDLTSGDSGNTLNALYNRNGIQYLQPIYKQLMGQAPMQAADFCFAGDHTTAISLAGKMYDSLSPDAYRDIRQYLDTLAPFQYRDARAYIISRASREKIVMINESHHQSQHRAFTISLLDDLYKAGYHYLALEMLNNRKDRNITDIDMRTGYYAAEPVAGELIRKALSLGYKLISYEDTLANKHSVSGRDAIQAAGIIAVLQKDSAAKILVHAGYAHISEHPIGENYTPMASFFKRITGINPFTIDQTEMSEGSSFEYGRYFYSELVKKQLPLKAGIAARGDRLISLLENDQYDVQIIHPPTTLNHGRPQWLSLDNSRKEVPIKPTEKALYLVQAYYEQETLKKPIEILIPADQTYSTDRDGYYWLYLQPGKYKIVMRDMDYALLSEKSIEVPGN